MNEDILNGIEARLAKASGKDGLDETEKRTFRRRMADLEMSYEAHQEGHEGLPPLKDQVDQVGALAKALASVEDAVKGTHPALWELVALEKDLPPETTQDLLAAAHSGEEDNGKVVMGHLGALATMREACESLSSRLGSRESKKGREYPVPLELVVDRFGLVYSTIVGSYPPISDSGAFVSCIKEVLDGLEAGSSDDVSGEAIKRATRFCIQHVWLKYP